jgi:hypothetical protein
LHAAAPADGIVEKPEMVDSSARGGLAARGRTTSVTEDMVARRNRQDAASQALKRASAAGELPWFYDRVHAAAVTHASTFKPLIDAPFEKKAACAAFYDLLFAASKPISESTPLDDTLAHIETLEAEEAKRFLIEWAYQTSRVRAQATDCARPPNPGTSTTRDRRA